MNPNRPFAALLVTGAAVLGILAAVLVRYVRAGIPSDGRLPQFLTWRYIVLPGIADLPIHLVSYLALCLLLVGLARGFWAVAGRARRTRSFVTHFRSGRTEPPVWLEDLAARLALGERLDVIAAPAPLAFCHGLLRPRVCVTTGLLHLLEHDELEAVLLHEAHHAHRRDPLRRWVADCFAATVFFLPLVAMLRDHHTIASEVSADQRALERMGQGRSLAAALYKLLAHGGEVPPTVLVGASGSLVVRVDRLLGQTISSRDLFPTRGLIWTVIELGLLLALLVVPLSLFASDLLHFHGHTFPRFR